MNVSIHTFGCKANQYDSALMKEAAARKYIKVVPPSDQTDVFVINTCTVTARTDYQSRQMIRRFQKMNPEAVIVVTGCYAQVAPDVLKKMGVHYVIGNQEKSQLWDLVKKDRPEKQQVAVGNIRQETLFGDLHGIGVFDRTRSYLKIQDGCDAFCTYCIVPYARGQGRSLPVAEVFRGIDGLVQKGFKEVILTGIHLGAYGQDLRDDISLTRLIKGMTQRYESYPDLRFRLSSIEPMEITEQLIEAIKNNPRICPHFHIPLQSGSDRILKLMKRPYTSEGFKKLILKLHEAGPFVSIGIDVMAGFPGETEEDIEQTIRFLGELPVTYFHVFPYSRRKGTPAARFEGQVVKSVAEGRCKKLRDLGSAKKKDFYEKNIGRTDQVLVESNRDKETDRLKGFSRNYIPVLLEGDDELQGQVVKVRLQEVKGEQMLGEIIS